MVREIVATVRRQILGLTFGLLAIFVALGGVSWAGDLISGKSIKKNSIPANRLTKSARSSLAGKIGPAGPQGPAGPAGAFTETVPSGKTIRGMYLVRFIAAAPNAESGTAISFGTSLPSAPTPHFIPIGTLPPPQCPTNALNPQAAPGHLCIYEASGLNRSVAAFDVNFNLGTASPFGANLLVAAAAAGISGTSGSWAVTAP